MRPLNPAAWPSLQRNSRRGVAAVWTLVVLSVLSVVLATITSQFLTSRRWLDRRRDQIQTLWAARAGVELAASRLLSNPAGYEGESWEAIPGSQVRIAVRREPDSPSVFQVTSTARFSTNRSDGVARTLTRRFQRIVEKDRVRIEIVAKNGPVKGKRGD